MTFRASIITLYPEMFPGPLGVSLAGNALERGDWKLETVHLREFGDGRHKRVDDTPAGGGAGMVLRADVLGKAIDSLGDDNRPRLLMSPRGKPLTQQRVRELAAGEGAIIVCGRFEGVDQRVIKARDLEEVSVGDYILSGGEPAALVLLDAIVRLLPGVMGNETSGENESFENRLLEHPQYTRPQEWENMAIPEVLTGGNHKKIAEWQHKQAEKLTHERRPDLLDQKVFLSDICKHEIQKLEESLWVAETRYDDAYMDKILAPDFIEIGKSGKTYNRSDMFFGGYNGQVIDCKLPLTDFRTRRISDGIVQTLYVSEPVKDNNLQRAKRSSIWQHADENKWQIVFHQGTMIND